MLPLIDTHVHLLAGLDDGPAHADEALAMARMLVAEGASAAAALAHQNDGYPNNDADRLRAATKALAEQLQTANIPLAVYPTGEVMLTADLVERLEAGTLLTVADRGQFLLVEMPHGAFVDVVPLAEALRPKGVRLIIAHAERYPELLHDDGLGERWIAAGCLIQFTAQRIAEPARSTDERAMKSWIRRGMVHLIGSDGHNLDWRPPRLKDGYERIVEWTGPAVADRIAHIWASAILEGRPVNAAPPHHPPRSWFSKLFG